MHKWGVLIALAAMLVAAAAPAQAKNDKLPAAYGKQYAKYYGCQARWYGPVFHRDKSKDGWGFYCYKTKPAKGKRFKTGVSVKPARYVGSRDYFYYKGKKYQKNANADYKDKYYYYPYK